MSVDLSKLQYFSNANSFKNDSAIYTGTLNFPTSVAASAVGTATASFTLDSSPVFSMLYAYYKDYVDLNASTGSAQWYQADALTRVGLTITAPSAYAGPVDGYIFIVINGKTATVTGQVNNPYSTDITLQPLAVPFAFIEYTLTN